MERGKRGPYQLGAKRWLASMEVGEVRTEFGGFEYRKLQRAASALKADWGVQYRFKKDCFGVQTITRVS